MLNFLILTVQIFININYFIISENYLPETFKELISKAKKNKLILEQAVVR